MADLYGMLVLIGFVGVFSTVTALLGLTYFAFTRMDPDVRRARMFIMEKRIERFLGAFTLGFIALTVVIIPSMVAATLPAALSGGLIFLWLGAMGYGTYELFLIVRPPRVTLFRIRRGSKSRSGQRADTAQMDRSGSETDAAK